MHIKRNDKDFLNSAFTLEVSGLELALMYSDMRDTNGVTSKEHFERDYLSVKLADDSTCCRVHFSMVRNISDLLSQYGIEE